MSAPTSQSARAGLRAARVGDRRGMTLVEVLISMAILGTMAALVYSGLVITIKSQRRAEMLQSRYHEARITLERMKRELAMSFVSLHQAEDQRTKTLFEGERDRIVFNTSAHEPWQKDVRHSDQLEVEYVVETVDGVKAIVRRVKFHIDDRPGKGGREEVMVKHVKRLTLEYFDKGKEDWRSDWTVRIDDAIEKRAQMKIFSQLRDMAQEQRDADTAGAGVQGALADAAAIAGAQQADQALTELEGNTLDDLFLPNRVRIRLELKGAEESDETLVLETQAELRVTDPLWF